MHINLEKKYIQQLTGKLSQKLRDYNSSLPEPDADLNKYVAGMILKQSVEGLSEEEKNEIIKKVNEGAPEDTDVEPDADNEEPAEDEMPMEGKKRKRRTVIMTESQYRFIQEWIAGEEERNRPEDKMQLKTPPSRKHRPFFPPNIK